jgi:LysR family transcriptional regulator, hydrogen peroxide-inducible genes activator
MVTVADLGSFTRAAERCGVAQPSLSQQIIKLERELGHPLFERSGRTISLTEAGRAVYTHAVTVLGSISEISNGIKQVDDPERGTVRLGAIPTIAPYLLPPILKRLGRQLPHAVVILHENLTEFTARGCIEGDLDFGITASPAEDARLVGEQLFTEELLLALPHRHPLTKRKTIRMADLAGEPFVLMNELHCLGQQVATFCKNRGCVPTVRCQGVQLLTIQELVSAGHGISLIPAMARSMDRGSRCEYRSIIQPPSRSIWMIWHRDRRLPNVARALMSMVRAHPN